MASNIITSSLLPKLVVPNQSASSFFLENLLKSNDAIALVSSVYKLILFKANL